MPIYFFELGNVKVLVLTFKTSLKTTERDRIDRMDVGGLQRGEKFTFKVARYSFSGSIPPKFEHKLRRHKQSFEKLPPQLY